MMKRRELTDEERREVHAQKRAVWAQEGAGKHYHHLAHQKEPVTRLKNLTEIGFVLRTVSGPRILDAGAGTGRFTFSLRDAGHSVTALDISRDMLVRGREHGLEVEKAFPCVQGEIEHLPFADGAFDSIVSMTVVRHFPEWPPLLDEYTRVIRDGGRIIFDMASGAQQQYGDSVGITRAHEKDGFQPLEFDAGVAFDEMQAYGAERGLGVAAFQPHDFFNGNPLLEHVLGPEKEVILEELQVHLNRDDVVRFCEMVHRRFLPAVGPAVCGSVLIVLEKGLDEEYQPPWVRRLSAAGDRDTPERTVLKVLEQSLGRRYASFMREASRHLDTPDVREFVAFCKEKLLGRWPMQTFYGDAGRRGNGQVD